MLGGQVEATLNRMTVPVNLLDDWNQFGHDSQHTFCSPFVGPQTNALKWRFLTDAPVRSAPTLAEDGTLLWSYQTDGAIQSSPAIGADGTVYVGSNDGKLYAFGPGAGN
jgi:hypothetical protein